jgi:two-component system phosphate regulon sensor histidine kinase PhoR
MWSFWSRPFATLAFIGIAALVAWKLASATMALSLCVVSLVVYLLIHLWHTYKLDHWLNHDTAQPPTGHGLCGDLLARLDKNLRERRELQTKSAADMEQLQAATRSLPDSIVILDQQSRILWMNDAAESHLGLRRGRDEMCFIYYLLRANQFIDWLNHGDYSHGLTISSPSRPELRLSLRVVPMPRAQRMLIGQDITEVERVESMRRDFVANVSHELRTPITVISGFIEAFDDMGAPAPEEFKKHIHLMREQSDRIRRLLDDLLTLARLESGPDMSNEPVVIPALIEDIYAEAVSLSQGRHTIDLLCPSHAGLLGNTQELRSALSNLVVNAVRYTPSGGHITIMWRDNAAGGVEFSVTDTGEGIEAKHIPRLTERFYRVDRGRSRATGGTGLGLAIVKHILQRHNARLRIESTIGKGSTFTALFPSERVTQTT